MKRAISEAVNQVNFFVFFVMVFLGFSSTLMASSQLDWNAYSAGTTYDLRGICFGKGKYIAVGNNGVIVQSQDGAEWETVPSFTTFNLSGVAFGNDIFVVSAGAGSLTQFWYSADGTNWVGASSSTPCVIHKIRYINGKFFAVGNMKAIISSIDATNWTTLSYDDASSDRLTDVTYGNGIYVAVGKNNDEAVILVSTNDGATWQSISNNISHPLNGVAFGRGKFVAVGGSQYQKGVILTSSNGINWNVQTASAEYIFNGAIYANELFVIMSSVIAISSDASQWTEQSTPIKPYYDMCYANHKFTGVGHRGTVIQSSPVSPKTGPVIFANGLTGTVAVAHNQPVCLTVTMKAGIYAGLPADWWLVAIPSSGNLWYYRNANGQWVSFPAGSLLSIRPAYQGAVIDIINPIVVLPATIVPTGTYICFFGLDQQDGILNYPNTLYESVTVVVE